MTKGIEDMINFGVGAIEYTRKRLTPIVDGFVESGKLTKQDGEKLINKIIELGNEQKTEIMETISKEWENSSVANKIKKYVREVVQEELNKSAAVHKPQKSQSHK